MISKHFTMKDMVLCKVLREAMCLTFTELQIQMENTKANNVTSVGVSSTDRAKWLKVNN